MLVLWVLDRSGRGGGRQAFGCLRTPPGDSRVRAKLFSSVSRRLPLALSARSPVFRTRPEFRTDAAGAFAEIRRYGSALPRRVCFDREAMREQPRYDERLSSLSGESEGLGSVSRRKVEELRPLGAGFSTPCSLSRA